VRAIPGSTRVRLAEDDLAVIAHSPAPADVDRRRRRIVRIRALRLILPITAAALLVGVIGQVTWQTIATVLAPMGREPGEEVRMDKPSFSGESRDGARYMVTAKSGLRDPTQGSRILLDSPTVTINRQGGPSTRTTARTGEFREDDLTLRLEGDVQVDNGGGYKFAFKNAVIDPTTGEVSGQGVQGDSPIGAVQSDQYTVYDQGQRMVFKGGVKGRIEAE
jgi:lipopolysaccharide export system protein LptC